MMFDMNMILSYKQTLTESGDSKYAYDRLLNGDDLQRALTLVAFLTNVVGTGSITVSLKTSANGSTWNDVWTSGAMTARTGRLVNIPLPHGLKRYIKLAYTLTGVTSVTVTAGVCDAHEVEINTDFVQKRDQTTGEIADLAAETDVLSANSAE